MNTFCTSEKKQITGLFPQFYSIHSSCIFNSSPKKWEGSLKNGRSYLFRKDIFTLESIRLVGLLQG